MCEANSITKFISISYIVFCFVVPLIYLFIYRLVVKKRRRDYHRAAAIAIIIGGILLSVKLVAYLLGDNCFNCYLNNECFKEVDNTTSKEVTKSDKTSTTEKITMTTTTKNTTEKTYKKVTEPAGVKKEVGKTSKGYTIETIDDVYYVDGYLIVNKSYPVPKDYEPIDAYATTNTPEKSCQNCINKLAYSAFNEMKADAAAVGINLWIQSGYRSYQLQNTLYNRYVSADGKAAADTYSARPGFSEHQTGLCFDLNDAGRKFNGTTAAKWVAQNAQKYGFIIRYPEGKTDETGYMWESWHLRYVGSELASKLYNNGDWITLEDYFGLTSKYASDN